MTVILPFGRAITRQWSSSPNLLLTRLASTSPLLRASRYRIEGPTTSVRCCACPGTENIANAVRNYATDAASKPASRPKAHTGRTAPRKTSTKSSAATKAKKPATKTKATTKPRTKAKAKPKPKPKPKSKPKRAAAPSKTALNRARVSRNKSLREKALLDAPKQLPATAWALYFSQGRKGVKNASDNAQLTKELAQQFKQIPSEELEQLNHTATQNKAKNDANYKQWLSKHTPAQIKEANDARRALSSEKKVKEGKRKAPVRLIRDDRLVKRPRNAYTYFSMSRFASGDFKHMAIPEAARLAGREWKALSASEKKPFEDQAQADTNRYLEEFKSVYGTESRAGRSRKAT